MAIVTDTNLHTEIKIHLLEDPGISFFDTPTITLTPGTFTAGFVVNPVSITSPCPDSPIDLVIFSYHYVADGGTFPYIWSISAGSLPPGLTLDSASGILSGTPTFAGTYTFTIHVQGADLTTDSKSCVLQVETPASTIARPTYIEEMEDPGLVNPIRSRVINGTLAADANNSTYAELQFDSSRSLSPDYANLLLSAFRPLPVATVDHFVVHAIVSYLQVPGGNNPHHATSLFNQRNPYVFSAEEDNGLAGTLETDQDDNTLGFGPSGPNGHDLSPHEFTFTIDSAHWASEFSSNADNIWVRSWQVDSNNYDLSSHCLYRVYEVWVEYFY